MSVACAMWNQSDNTIYMVSDSCLTKENEHFSNCEKMYELKSGIWVAATGTPQPVKEFPVKDTNSLESMTRPALEYITEGFEDIDDVAQIIFNNYVSLHKNLCMLICGFKNGEHRVIELVSDNGRKLIKGLNICPNNEAYIIGAVEVSEAAIQVNTEQRELIQYPDKFFQLVIDRVIEIRKSRGLGETVMYPIKIIEIRPGKIAKYYTIE